MIFEPFKQADETITRRYGGTGLGLAICHQLVTLLGGSIAVSSEPEKGTEFRVEIPKNAPKTQAHDVPSALETAVQNQKKKVLVVEDNDSQAQSITAILGSVGIETFVAIKGEQALEILNSPHAFDCVILDLSLPDISGLEVLKKLAKAENRETHRPIIIHTAIDLTRAEEQELKKYANALVLKGASSMKRLLDEVSVFLHTSFQTIAYREKLRPVQASKLLEGERILLVDDDMRNVFALTSALEQSGAKVKMAQNGVEALEELKKDSSYDVVLMDMMMPTMDGLEATRFIREELGLKTLPIIALTAKAMKHDREDCIRAGANDYLSKPIEIQRLQSLIRIWTNRV